MTKKLDRIISLVAKIDAILLTIVLAPIIVVLAMLSTDMRLIPFLFVCIVVVIGANWLAFVVYPKILRRQQA